MFCPNCGTKNDEHAVFCKNCGTRLEVTPTATRKTPIANQRPISSEQFSATRATQTANKPASSRRNGIIIAIVIAVVVIAAGGGYYFYRQSQKSNVTATAAPKKKANSQTANSQAATKSTSKATSEAPTKAALWSTAKTADLSSFMSSWQDTMNQSYIGTYDGQSVDDDGVSFPEDIKNGSYKSEVTVDNNEVTLKWTSKANTDDKYQVVAAAVYDHEKDGEEQTIAYLYVFHNDEPDVLVSQDTDSDVHNFTSSRNQDLQNGFAKIANAATNH
ncbi:Hypothetical protein ADU72_0520 [Pediococcus damnosus]|uniref:Uncharacterized protein n=1 Tax=Pediococcus damnosus TaxID=51663 RepID=A0A0R2HND1_9LACO|nr:zinc ribbon domain-containing protein [Pediococcus damnosus]AMV63596.1 Hypothetical protein ADU70_2130 [Pediococcus damnosus]AMV66465.1 Hypothetical protein ADU72_0520 [Pediococcus damnosus]AMV68767.1 Hypothetical protein ADU73_0357 [Pediococcus damnosus]KJU73547.1 hypothetical protein AH70_00920 [Pediococcus damnosus LMG 28219]KRN54014.1 hypothetical protein IV84_GL000701 [Pediococcus damnosus]